MNLNLLNMDEVCAKLPEITNSKYYENRRYFSKTGLFSQQIFGPLKSYKCSCPRITRSSRQDRNKRCTVCGVELVKSDERRKRFAKIKLPFPIYNPLFYNLICGSRRSIKKVLNNLLMYKCRYYFDNENNLVEFSFNETPPTEYTILEGLEGAVFYTKIIAGMMSVSTLNHVEEQIDENDSEEYDDEETIRKEFEYIQNHSEHLIINNILVIPPDYRPCGAAEAGNSVLDNINEKYSILINICNEIKSIPYHLSSNEELYKSSFRNIQKTTLELYDHVLDRMSKKTGLIRSNILGKRVDFSGRAVISPDPTLLIDECRMPYFAILEIFKPQLVTYFINRRLCKLYNQAYNMIEDSIQTGDLKFFNIVQEFCEDKVCVLNRQPTLHRLSMLAFKIKLHTGNTIQIHPMICHAYNADFDGDQMAAFCITSAGAEEDARTKIGVWNNLISPTNIQIVPRPNQDIVLGIYALTKE